MVAFPAAVAVMVQVPPDGTVPGAVKLAAILSVGLGVIVPQLVCQLMIGVFAWNFCVRPTAVLAVDGEICRVVDTFVPGLLLFPGSLLFPVLVVPPVLADGFEEPEDPQPVREMASATIRGNHLKTGTWPGEALLMAAGTCNSPSTLELAKTAD